MGGWAYIHAPQGPTGSILYMSHGTKATGSNDFYVTTGSSKSDVQKVILTGSLHVSGTIHATSYTMRTINTTFSSGSTKFGDTSDDKHQFIGTISGSGPLQLGGAAHFKNNIYTSGSVGIGTATPSNQLEIEGSSGDLIFEIDNNASNSANFQIQNGAGNARVDLVMNDGSANTIITMKGQKVGIGDTSPSYTLDVGGNTQVVTDLFVGGDISGSSALRLGGAAYFKNNIYTSGSISGSGNVTIKGNTVLKGALNVSGAVTYAGASKFTSISASSHATVVGSTTLKNALNVSGTATFAGASKFASISGSGTATIVGPAILKNALNVSGTATFAGASKFTTISGSSTLQLGGAAFFKNNVNISGNVKLGATGSRRHEITGSTYVTGTLSIKTAFPEKSHIKLLSQDNEAGLIFMDANVLSIASDSNIMINPDGGTVDIKDGGDKHFLFDCNNTAFTIYDDTAEADLFKIQTAANGATAITTNDNDGAAGHITLDPDGDVILDGTTKLYFTDATYEYLQGDGTNMIYVAAAGVHQFVSGESILLSGAAGKSSVALQCGNGADNYNFLSFMTGGTSAAGPYNTVWNFGNLSPNYAGGAIPYYKNLFLLTQYHDAAGTVVNGAAGYAHFSITDSGSIGLGRNNVQPNADNAVGIHSLHPSNRVGLNVKGPPNHTRNMDMSALFVSGCLHAGTANSFIINATCAQKKASGPLFYVSSSGLTVVETDLASGYPLQVTNDGDDANRYGIQIQAGADDASGQTFYINCNDGDGGNVGYIENNGGTFRLVDPSDKRLKKNIKDTKLKGLETVGKIKVRDFELKKNNISKTGFIAQELDKVYPSAVSSAPEGMLDPNGNPRMMGVSYEALVPLLIKAVQELSAEVKELKKKLDSG